MIKEIQDLIESTCDELIAILVVGGSMVGYFTGVEVPIELPAGIIAFYFVRKNVEINIK